MKILKLAVKVIILTMLIATFIYVLGLSYITHHENIHYRIFDTYNINSTVEIDYLWLSGSTTPESYKDCDAICLMQHRFNDIVGYNTKVLVFTLWTIFICYLAFKRLFRK